MSEIDHIVLKQYSWNQHNFGHSKSQLFVTVQFDFVMGEKYHQPAMASHWDESSGGYSIAHCPNNADVGV